MLIWTERYAPMFIAALFIIARTWKQLRCPSADEWIRKLWYIYSMEYYLAIKVHCSSTARINAGEGMEKREPSYTVGGNANYYSHYGEQCGDSLKNWK